MSWLIDSAAMGTNLASTATSIITTIAPFVPYLLGAGLLVAGFKVAANWMLGRGKKSIK